MSSTLESSDAQALLQTAVSGAKGAETSEEETESAARAAGLGCKSCWLHSNSMLLHSNSLRTVAETTLQSHAYPPQDTIHDLNQLRLSPEEQVRNSAVSCKDAQHASSGVLWQHAQQPVDRSMCCTVACAWMNSSCGVKVQQRGTVRLSPVLLLVCSCGGVCRVFQTTSWE